MLNECLSKNANDPVVSRSFHFSIERNVDIFASVEKYPQNYNGGVAFITCISCRAVSLHSLWSGVMLQLRLDLLFFYIYLWIWTSHQQYPHIYLSTFHWTLWWLAVWDIFAKTSNSSEWKPKPQLDWAILPSLELMSNFFHSKNMQKKVSLTIDLNGWFFFNEKPHKCNNNASFPEISNSLVSSPFPVIFSLFFQFPVHYSLLLLALSEIFVVFNILVDSLNGTPWWVWNDQNWYFFLPPQVEKHGF